MVIKYGGIDKSRAGRCYKAAARLRLRERGAAVPGSALAMARAPARSPYHVGNDPSMPCT